MSLAGRTIVMSGGSRGIGLAIAERAARDGANVALMAKTAEPHPKLEGTVFTAAERIEAAGGRALPVVGDVRDAEAVTAFVTRAAEHFGGIDIVVNNASAIDLRGTRDLDVSKYDLMQTINTRGTYVLTKAAVPHLEASDHAHILTLSPPLDLDPRWIGPHIAYTLSKYGMSLATLGFAHEFRDVPIAANALWPRTLIATAAVQNLLGGDAAIARSRTPQIVADAAYEILTSDPASLTGRTLIDDEVLRDAGVTDLSHYRADPDGSEDLAFDLYIDRDLDPAD
ncbi:MAG: NAD(P)-dependent oxidoreductase [Nitriliruptoraceae bacterium]|nr:NAD(P)-dependent oxidoreductase [Nitriliruptoraceae bacterium]